MKLYKLTIKIIWRKESIGTGKKKVKRGMRENFSTDTKIRYEI